MIHQKLFLQNKNTERLVNYRKDYKKRSAIERFFGKIKKNKRLAIRFESLMQRFFLVLFLF